MTDRVAAVLDIWRGRRIRTVGDRAFVVYLIVMVALVTIVPVARAVWLSATSDDGIALLSSPDASRATSMIVAALWAGAWAIGRDRGPALRAPVPTHALAGSDLSRWTSFRGPALRAGAGVTAATTLVAGLVGAALVSRGLADPAGALGFVAAGALAGTVASVAWLAGQAFPRAAAPAALVVLAGGILVLTVPEVAPFAPWAWVGDAYPAAQAARGFAPVMPLTALAALLVVAAPALMSRIDAGVLSEQAGRWDLAVVHATGMDLRSATTLYQRRPSLGRRVRAVRPMRQRAMMFALRDAVASARTPGRLLVGVASVAASGALVAVAAVPGMPRELLGAAAGLVLFAALGPLTDGVRHAANVAADFPLYGISDERLLASHLVFPVVVMVVVLLAAATVCAIVIGMAAVAPVVGSLVLGMLALLARVADALKGPLPPALLTPIPTPVGDLGAAVRLMWALDAVILAAASGAVVALGLPAPVVVAAVVGGIAVVRWRRRG